MANTSENGARAASGGGAPAPAPLRVLHAPPGAGGDHVVVGPDGRMTLVQSPGEAAAPAPPRVLHAPPGAGGDHVVVGPDGRMTLVQSPGEAAAPAPLRVLHAPPGAGGDHVVVGPDGRMVLVQSPGEAAPLPPAAAGAPGERVVIGADGRPVVVRAGSGAAPGAAAVAPALAERAPATPDSGPAVEMHELIGYAPNWLVRWGITCVFGVLAVLLAISWFIHYPETVDGRATVTTPNPPVRLVARVAAELGDLRVADGQAVPAGAVLAVLKNPASSADVETLSRWLDGVDPARPGDPPARPLSLGEVQGAYADLLRAFSDLRAFDRSGYYRQKASELQAQADAQARLGGTLQSQQQLLQQDVALARAERDRSRELARRQLISPQELAKAEQDFLQKEYTLRNGQNGVLSSSVQLAGQRAALLDLERSRAEERRQYEVAARASFAALRAAVSQWEQSYVLRAPAAGRVSFFKPLAAGQFVAASEPVMAVVPERGLTLARVQVGPAAAGQVQPGQSVVLEFDSYPRAEWGTVRGHVRRVALLGDRAADPEKDPVYQVEVELPQGLRTGYGRVLPFRQEMSGKAHVVTHDLRLLERMLNRLHDAVSRSNG